MGSILKILFKSIPESDIETLETELVMSEHSRAQLPIAHM